MFPVSRPKLHYVSIAALAFVLSGCHTPSPATRSATESVASTASAPILRQDAFKSIYEVTTSADANEIFVATINGFDLQNAGFIQRLDARTLQVVQTIQVPRRSFALGLNRKTKTLYIGNTLDGSLSVVDASSGLVKGVIQLATPQTNDKGEETYAHTRKVIVDEKHDRVFVTSPGEPGLIWIVDGKNATLTHTITSDGVWSAGAAYDPATNRLYVGQGGINEVLVIDPDSGTISRRLSTGETPSQTVRSVNFFINVALDAKGARLFAAGGQKNQVYVWDLASGRVVQRIPFKSAALDIVYNPVRNEVVTTHRGNNEPGSGVVSILDAATYEIKRTIELPVHPNSLALSGDGQTVYVTVKAARSDKHPAYRKDAQDSVVRIDLR